MLTRSSVEHVFDHSPLGAIVIDEDGTLANANRASARMFRCPVDELVGAPLTRLACPEERARLVPRLMARVWPPRSARRWFRRLDGTPLLARTTSWLLDQDPSVCQRHAIILLEDLVSRAPTDLPAGVGPGDAALVAAALAHEVRNPITGISGALRVIHERLPAGSPEREVIEQAHARLDSLDRVVDDLYLYARIGAPAADRVSLATVLRSAREHLQALPDLANMTVIICGDITVPGDAPMLATLFQRLVRTAARTGSSAGRLEVRLARTRQTGTVTLILQSATPTVVASLRDGFGSVQQGQPGSAPILDLLLARQIAVAHGGDIDAIWEGGQAQLVVRLPLQ